MKLDGRLLPVALAVAGLAGGWLLRDATLRPVSTPREPALPSATPPTARASEVASAAPPPSASAPTDSSLILGAFDTIYKGGVWGETGGVGSSGFGSSLRATLLYRAFLQQFLKDAAIRSVVDAGCGDWEFSQAIDWSGVDYKGYDIVPAVIARNQQRYGKPKVRFFVGDILRDELPAADLLIVKNVLQHLTNADVAEFLKRLPRYKHALLINGVSERTLSAKNDDIAVGKYRELDPTRPPFKARGAKLLTYWDGGNMQQVVYVPGPGASPFVAASASARPAAPSPE